MGSRKEPLDLLHVLLVSFPGQGHINPLLRLGKLLASKGGCLVTFSTTIPVSKKMKAAGASVSGEPTPVGNCGGMIRFEFFDDGLSDEDAHKREDLDMYLPQLEAAGKKEVTGILERHAHEGRPVSCLINSPFIPWVADVAEALNIPSAMLWVQSCACFSAYYHYKHTLLPFPSEEEPDIDVQLPKMPLLKHDEIPSFLHPSSPYPFLRRAVLAQFNNLSKLFCVLMETFQELEDGLINYMSEISPIRPVGPLFKNPILESSSNISADFIKADDCLEWLDSKEPSSVVYISVGSVVNLSQEQVTEMAYGILNSGVSFLWVLRRDLSFKSSSEAKPGTLPDGFLEAAGRERGIRVQWSPQDKVLAHPAVACFVTHCGWNSTLEALSSGVPLVTFPQWGDQVTNAKYLCDEWKVGIRMSRGEADNNLISREEIERCLREATGGVKAAEIKKNALKWKKAAEEAVAEGGTSDRNIQGFIEDLRRFSVANVSKIKPKMVAQ